MAEDDYQPLFVFMQLVQKHLEEKPQKDQEKQEDLPEPNRASHFS